MHQFETAVFDLDGTLLDTSQGLISAVDYTVNKFSLRPLTHDEKLSFIGPPIQNSFARVYNFSGDILQKIATVFRDYYKNYSLYEAKPYDGIYELFDELVKNEIKPSVATYKRQDYARDILIHFGFDKYTDILLGADHENRLSKKDIIENALKMANVTDLSRAVMIGDSDNDAIGAEKIGMKFIAVTYGFGFKSKTDADKFSNIGCADNVYELKKLLIG